MWCHDIPSLYAGKIAALFSRTWEKGRDVYDLAWFLKEYARTTPNIPLLNQSLRQTAPNIPAFTPTLWRTRLSKRLRAVNWKKAIDEIESFRITDPARGATVPFDQADIKKLTRDPSGH